MKNKWLKKCTHFLALTVLLTTYLPALIVGKELAVVAADKAQGKIILDNEYLKVTAISKVKGTKLDWHVKFQQKNITAKRNLVFSIYKEDQALSVENISLQTKENFVSNDGIRWRQKEFTDNELEEIHFTTSKEKSWYFILHDLELTSEPTDDINITNQIDENDYQDLLKESKVGPYELPYEETETTTTTENKPEETVSRTQNTTSPTETAETSDEVSYEGFRKVDIPITGSSKLVPDDAISISGIFDTISVGTSSFTSEISGNTYTAGPTVDGRGIYIAGKNNKVSVFSKTDYRMDFSKSFEGMSFVSMGLTDSDGFAFVLQNDNNGSKALTKSDKGSSLGAFGRDDNSEYPFHSLDPIPMAIQNSIAISFDLHMNGAADYRVKTPGGYNSVPHLSYGFPGSKDGYQGNNAWGTLGNKSFVHNNIQFLDKKGQPTVKNEQSGAHSVHIKWNQLYYKYEVNKGFTYWLNDENNQPLTTPVTIPYNQLEKYLDLKNHENKAYWGFTGANGSDGGMNGIGFAKIPVATMLEANVYKENVSEENKITLKSHNESSLYLDLKKNLIFSSMYWYKGEFLDKERDLKDWKIYWDPRLIPVEAIKGAKLVYRDLNNNLIETKVLKINGNSNNGEMDIVKLSPGELSIEKIDGVPKLFSKWTYSVELEVDSTKITREYEPKLSKELEAEYLNSQFVSKINTQGPGDKEPQLDTATGFYAVPWSKGKLTLDAVPNFEFNNIQLKEFLIGQSSVVTPVKDSSNISSKMKKEYIAYDGNNKNLVQVTNSIKVPWQLKARFETPFIDIENDKNKILNPTILLSQDKQINNNDSIVLSDDENQEQIKQVYDSKTNTQLRLPAERLAIPQVGTYQATISWTLENTPSQKGIN